MEAEIVPLAHSCCKLFPIMDGVSIMGKAIGLPVGNTTIQVSNHEDNPGALILAKTIPPQYTSQSKDYYTRTIWFQKEIVNFGIRLLKIFTTKQLGYLFPKGLPKPGFEHLRKKLMGWKFSDGLMLERKC